MSLYEILSMNAAFEKQQKGAANQDRPMTDDEFDASKEKWRAMNLPDVDI